MYMALYAIQKKNGADCRVIAPVFHMVPEAKKKIDFKDFCIQKTYLIAEYLFVINNEKDSNL